MVSCQWRLTSGPRAGQACGRGKEVFCKTHAPRAKETLSNFFRDWRNNPVNQYLSQQQSEAERLIFGNARYDFSKSWIWDSETNELRGVLSPTQTYSNYPPVSGANIMREITFPQTIANWLEDIYSTSVVRGEQIFPQPITQEQLNAIGALAETFRQRMDAGKYVRDFYAHEMRDSRRGKPLPFFQNRNYNYPIYNIYNEKFVNWMQRCINYSPDYVALWNWFLPEFTNNMATQLDVVKRGYDIDAIQQDLKTLRLAYQSELREQEQQNRQNQVAPNRYIKQGPNR